LVAALDASSGLATAWNANAGGESTDLDSTCVYALSVSRSTVYIGGYFDTIGGQDRPYLARFSLPRRIHHKGHSVPVRPGAVFAGDCCAHADQSRRR
jgi:hypothetical protein